MTKRIERDALGDRIKAYERRETDRRAMRGVPLLVRVDGRSFSKFTRGMTRPYDTAMADLMVEVAKYLVEQTHARVGFTQSDEISIVLEPFGHLGIGEVRRSLSEAIAALGAGDPIEAQRRAEALMERASAGASLTRDDDDFMFGGRFQKLASVSAGLATARFLKGALALWPARCAKQLPVFDCRVFEVPNRDEAVNALVWRELDATKNAVSMAAQANFSHARLQGKSSAEMQEMLFQERGINFNDYPARFKRGVYVQRRRVVRNLADAELDRIPEGRRPSGPIIRAEIAVLDLPPITRIANRVEVLLDGADPRPITGQQDPPKSTNTPGEGCVGGF